MVAASFLLKKEKLERAKIEIERAKKRKEQTKRPNFTICYNTSQQKENRRESALWAYLVDSCILQLLTNALTG